MKKIIVLAVTVCLCILTLIAPASAEEKFSDPYFYELINNGKEVMITRYKSATYISPLYVPGTIEGKPVTAIGIGAFKDWTQNYVTHTVGDVVLPEGLKRIEGGAFSGSFGLAHVELPSTLEYIGAAAFQQCVRLEEIVLPEGLVTIDGSAFAGCSKMNKNATLVIPKSVKTIGSAAFEGCRFSHVILNCTDAVLEMEAFARCINLESVQINGRITEVQTDVFKQSILKRISFPEGLTRIGPRFFSANRISSVVLPASLKTIDEEALPLNLIPNGLVFYGYEGSAAHQYAQKRSIRFQDITHTGDVDGDGAVTSTDARMLLQYSVGKIRQEDLLTDRGDADFDESITSTDARLVLQRSVDKISIWP